MRDTIAGNDPIHPWANAKDVINTLAVPTLLLLAARYTAWFDKPPSGDEPEVAGSAPGGERDFV